MPLSESIQVRVLRLDGETAIGTRTTQKGAQRLDRVGPQQLPRHPCGYRRVHAALARRGVETSPDTVRSIMRSQRLEAAQPRRKVRTTVPAADLGSRPDLVRRNFTANRPGVKWVGDITYIRTWEGFVYLATVPGLSLIHI